MKTANGKNPFLKFFKDLVTLCAKILLITGVFAGYPAFAQPTVISCGHSHNDYLHRRPLSDALAHGMFSVEADIFYADGKFLVAHVKAGIRQKRTLIKLYLEPLLALARKHNGSIYANGPQEFVLMLDLKGGWNAEQVKALEKTIAGYREMLTVFENGLKKPGAVRIVLSGSGGGLKQEVAASNPRYFSIDGGLGDMDSPFDENLVPRISASYGSVFSWRGVGKIPPEQQQLMRDRAAKAALHQRELRFWAATNRKAVWRELLDAGVHWLNVDRLKKFKRFYWRYAKQKN